MYFIDFGLGLRIECLSGTLCANDRSDAGNQCDNHGYVIGIRFEQIRRCRADGGYPRQRECTGEEECAARNFYFPIIYVFR